MAESQRPRGQCTVGVNVRVNSPEAERQGGASDSATTDGGLSPDRQRRSLAPANHPTESGIPSAAVNGQSPKPVQRRPPYDDQQGESSGPAATERGPSPDPTRTAPASASTSDVSSNGFHGYASYEVNAPASWKPDDAMAPETTGNEDTTRIIEALRRKLARGQAENEEMQLQLRELEEMTSVSKMKKADEWLKKTDRCGERKVRENERYANIETGNAREKDEAREFNEGLRAMEAGVRSSAMADRHRIGEGYAMADRHKIGEGLLDRDSFRRMGRIRVRQM
uniref:Uncharacterized protein n=1 Tax=Anopheles atroparvus TaxID=41427 RepID=A0A182JBW1_ANOAO